MRIRLLLTSVLIAVSLLAGGNLLRTREKESAFIARAKAATFEMNVRYAFFAYTTLDARNPKWRPLWDKFAAKTGAVLVSVEPSYLVSRIFFYTSNGGTAFFIGQDTKHGAVALTNWHIVDMRNEEARLRRLPEFAGSIAEITNSRTFVCPNFSRYDEYPSCSMNADWEIGDTVLDFAVITFPVLSAKVTTLPLGSYEDVRPGTRIIVVGDPLGIEDVVQRGETFAKRVPYFHDFPKWKWVVPYDVNSVGGYSGSPVIDMRTGRVIGLHRGAILDPRGSGRSIGLFVPMELIARVLATYGYPIDYSQDVTQE